MDEADTGPDVLWRPGPERMAGSGLAHYQAWLRERHGLQFDDYESLWQWSVTELDAFWRSVWDHFQVEADGSPEPVLAQRTMPGAQWFPATRLNYAEHVFRNATDARPAIVARDEGGVREVAWAQLQRDTGALAAWLRAQGIGPGDRVASYLPNRPETVIAFLACASIGAIWSSCSPDMGPTVVLDRLRQIEPKLLLATDSYSYNGKVHDRGDVVGQLLAALPTVQAVLHVPGPMAAGKPVAWPGRVAWVEATRTEAPLAFTRLPFGHPLWIVYSSGTTGLPKAMVHGHGGIVLTHLKTMTLQHDLRPGDRLMFLGGTGWIVWNLQVGALLTGASIVLYDGNPAWPDTQALWRFMDAHGVTLFGCGAAFLVNCMKEGLRPRDFAPLEHLRAINATGSPLPEDAYRWVYDAVKPDVWLASISGGTDIASGFVACAPTLPVVAGEIQCRELGVAAYAYDEAGNPVVDAVGELVVTQPMPSMPLSFWGDDGNRRYLESYFDMFPGVWRHGDWIRFTPRGSAVIYGRSDSTINRFGIRMGTAEIYRVVEELPEIRDSLVVDLEYLGRPSFMPLFVVLDAGRTLDDELEAAHRPPDPRQGVAAPRAQRDPAGRGSAAHAHGQEDGSAGAQAAAGRRPAEGRQPGRDGQPGQPAVLRGPGRALRAAGGRSGQVALAPGGDEVGRVGGVGVPAQQVVGVGQRHETLGMLRVDEDAGGVADRHGVVHRRVQDEQCAVERGDMREDVLFGGVHQELTPDAERPARQLHQRLAVRLDRRHLVAEQPRHVLHVARRAEGGDGAHLGHRPGGDQHRGAAQAVADQQRWRLAGAAQPVGRRHQVLHVGREVGVGELSLAVAEPGEVEAQHRDPVLHQRARDAGGGEDVLAAGEAVGEQRVRAHRPVRRVQAGGEHAAVRPGKAGLFALHGRRSSAARSQLPRLAAAS